MSALELVIKGDVPEKWSAHFKQLNSVEQRLAITRKIAGVIMQDAEQAFEEQASPEGKKWKKLNDQYLVQRLKKGYDGPILQRTGMLAMSLSPRFNESQAMVVAHSPYAKYHQLGTSKMPVRPFLGLSKMGHEEINDIFKRYFLK